MNERMRIATLAAAALLLASAATTAFPQYVMEYTPEYQTYLNQVIDQVLRIVHSPIDQPMRTHPDPSQCDRYKYQVRREKVFQSC